MPTSANLALGFDISPDATSGLTLGLGGGHLLIGGRWLQVANQTIALAPSATNYVEIGAAGLTANVTAFTSGRNFLYVISTNATAITGIEDWRANPAVKSPNPLLSSTATKGVGYETGAGGSVTQATNRTTGVTLNTVTGTITTNNASLAAEAAAEFTVTNSTVAATDTVVASIQSGSNGGNTDVIVSGVAAGSFNLKVANNNAAAGTAETGAILINFAVVKGVAA